MKKIYLILTALILAFGGNLLKAQNNFWTFPKEFWRPEGLVVSPLASEIYGFNATSGHVHAGIQDPYGEVMLAVIDDEVYNKSGLTEALFWNSTGYYLEGTSQSLIVPQPGSCSRFYIFQAGNISVNGGDYYPHFGIYNHDYVLGQLEDPNYHTANRIDGTYTEAWTEGHNTRVNGVHFAATKERPDNTRWIFISNNNAIYRVDLTCDTLVNTGWKYEYGVDELDFGWRSELEIYEDNINKIVRVAVPYRDVATSQSEDIKVVIFDIDSTTGDVVFGSRKTLGLPNSNHPSFHSHRFVHGLEFSPDGKLLYVLHEPSEDLPSPLSFYEIATETLTNLNYSNISNFEFSQLQIAGEPGDYKLWIASENYLGSLSNPNFPLINPTANWDPAAVPLNSYPLNYGGNPYSAASFTKRIVPTQIDYEDYEDIFLRTCDCCKTYAYAGMTSSITYEASASETWTYVSGNNPWNAVAGETIYIRDELVIPAGIHINIEGMTFKFG